jgi:hypothetical protein
VSGTATHYYCTPQAIKGRARVEARELARLAEHVAKYGESMTVRAFRHIHWQSESGVMFNRTLFNGWSKRGWYSGTRNSTERNGSWTWALTEHGREALDAQGVVAS